MNGPDGLSALVESMAVAGKPRRAFRDAFPRKTGTGVAKCLASLPTSLGTVVRTSGKQGIVPAARWKFHMEICPSVLRIRDIITRELGAS